MHRIPSWLLTTAAACLAVVSTAAPAAADSLSAKQQQLHSLQAQAASAAQQAQADQAQAAALQQAIQRYTESLNLVQQQASANAQQLAQLKQQLQQLQQDISHNQQALTQAKQQLQDDIRLVYEGGNVSYLDVLLQSTSFADLLDRLDTLMSFAQHQQQLAQQVSALHTTLVQEQARKTATYQTLQQKQRDYELLIQTDVSLKNAKQQAYAAAAARVRADNQQHALLESQIHLTQTQIDAIVAATQAAEQRMQDPSYLAQAEHNLSAVNRSQLVRYAESFIGTPYAWGGTSPSGFDCSGFTQYVFAHFGVALARTSEDQFGQGVPVSESALQPGDLVFFSTYAPGATHVGIYIGGGMMVDAEDAGCIIASIHSSYWGSRYIGARRVLTTAS
ncbi:MAG: C40 family peptidase [Alicyclobacillus sp.]|nr:C40 family peptidase [Alicyclobacillus sp.]